MISQEYLSSILKYNKRTGIFVWLKSKGTMKAGCVAGTKNKDDYVKIYIDKKPYKAHRLAWLYTYGEMPANEIDHINGNKFDNKISNLRCVSVSENSKNKRIRKDNSSGVHGVYWNAARKKWVSEIKSNTQKTYLGCFVDIFEAICARKSAEVRHGFHINHGH